nr:helitron helicase-like domain-containing protein [Tanacetum cinerariifolium]
MKILDWMISEEMKQTEHYRMYALVFGIDVPLIQSPPTESTHGTHRTPSALAHLPLKWMQEARKNVAPVEKHLASEEIEKMVEGQEHVVDDSSIPRNDEHNISGTRLEPKSDKESPEVGITDVIVPVNVYDEDEEEDEITDEVYKLKRREKGKNVEEYRITPLPTPIRSPRIHTDLVSSDTEKLQELMVPHTTPSSSLPSTNLSHTNRLLSLFKVKPARFKRNKSFFQELHGHYGYLFEHLRAKFMPRKSFVTLADHLHEAMADSLTTITKEEMENMIAKAILQECGNIQASIFSQIQQAIVNDIPSQVDASVRSYMSGHILHVHPAQPQTTYVPEQQYQLDQDDPHDDAHPEGEKGAKRQKTSEYEIYVSRESSSGYDNEHEQGPSTSDNQEQADDYDFWTNTYALDDDEIPTKQVSQDIMKEVSLNVNEVKLKKIADEMLRQRCTLGDEHQYHIDQMKNFLKSDIVWESHLLYLKKGNLRPEKIVLSLHKFSAVVFNDDDIEERTSRCVNKYVKKFNLYARYGVEHWKSPYAKIFYIWKQKEPEKPKEIIARRANDWIVSITEPDFKNLNKNDIEDMYLLIMNEKVPDYAETSESLQQKVNLTAPTIYFPKVEKHEMFSIIYESEHGIIYKNSKKEKRVMRHSKIHKFCDATLNKVLEGLKSYNNDVRQGALKKREGTPDGFKRRAWFTFEESFDQNLNLEFICTSTHAHSTVGTSKYTSGISHNTYEPPIKNPISITKGSTSVSNKQRHILTEGALKYELTYMPILMYVNSPLGCYYQVSNEVRNCLSPFGGENITLRTYIVEGLFEFLDTHNVLVQLFRTTRNKYMDADIPEFKIRLYGVIGSYLQDDADDAIKFARTGVVN